MLAELNSIYGERTNGITENISPVIDYSIEEEIKEENTKKLVTFTIEDPEREVPP